MPQILHKKRVQKAKIVTKKFLIDCSQPVEDKVLMTSDFESFLKKRIKVNGKKGNLGSEVVVKAEGSKLTVSAELEHFSKRYLKYLTKKYLKKQQLRDYLHVVATEKNTYSLKYFNIHNEEMEEE
uniref:Large ribosomal subunit protein eL22 n=1 Tax=Cryptocaryon irritans TaxID=153251 RepID=A0A075BFI8_9CILI|nr:ribosomal protein L22 [Cryptocaryon irritans]